jgi:hypothetical protein
MRLAPARSFAAMATFQASFQACHIARAGMMMTMSFFDVYVVAKGLFGVVMCALIVL